MSKDKFDYFIKGEKNKYEVIIGLEVHAQVSSNSTTYVSTGLQASITPRSASNKIMVSFEHSIYHVNASNSDLWSVHGIKIKRGTQAIYTPVSSTGASNGPYDFGAMASSSTFNHYGRSKVEYLDSPATTGSITYSTEIACYDGGGNVYVNYGLGAQVVAPQSWMTLTEITA